MTARDWRPKVGERVAINGIVVNDDATDIPFMAQYENGSTEWFCLHNLAPLPAASEPRKPWEVLREAIALIPPYERTTRFVLSREADRLEAAAAPKPPTLREAVRAFLSADMCHRHTDHIKAMEEALAREEGA